MTRHKIRPKGTAKLCGKLLEKLLATGKRQETEV
jgi:hypothetical protein